MSCRLEIVDIPCPEIIRIEPTGAKVNEKVTIIGRNFVLQPKLYNIKIDDIIISELNILNDSSIEFIVPNIVSGLVSILLSESNCLSNSYKLNYYYTGLEVSLFAGKPNNLPCIDKNADCLNSPSGIDLDRQGNLIVSDKGNNVVRIITPNKIFITIGTFTEGLCYPNKQINAGFRNPSDVYVDANGDIFIADSGNCAIFKTGANDSTMIYAGYCQYCELIGGSCDIARMQPPYGIYKYGTDIFITDVGHVGVIKTNTNGSCDSVFLIRDTSEHEYFMGIEVNTTRTGSKLIYLTDKYSGKIKSCDMNGNIQTISPLGPSELEEPSAIVMDSKGNIFISDRKSNKIFVLYLDGHLSKLAGTGGMGIENGPSNLAKFNGPSGLALDEKNRILYIADTYNNVIRKLTYK